MKRILLICLLVLTTTTTTLGGCKSDNESQFSLQDTIYLGSSDSHLYALTSSGTLKWKYATGEGIYSTPIIGLDGTIYVSSDDGNLYAINTDGILKWKYYIGELYRAAYINNSIYICTFGGNIYSINLDGTLSWRKKLNMYYYYCRSIQTCGDSIYVLDNNGKIFALYLGGMLKWENDSLDISHLSVKEDTIYANSHYELYALDAQNGTIKWSYPINEENEFIFTNNVGSSQVYLGIWSIEGSKVVALDLQGNIQWTFMCDPSTRIESITLDNNYSVSILTATHNTYTYDDTNILLYTLDKAGVLQWRTNIENDYPYSLIVGSNNTTYIGAYSGNLYAIDDNGILKWAYQTEGSECSPAVDTQLK